jgi:hypothetical protein
MTTRLVRAAPLLLALTPLACGGGGGGGDASSGFCASYANAVCQKTFACPDLNNPIPAGATMADCVQSYTKLCTDPPAADVGLQVNCDGKPTVNAAAQAECVKEIGDTKCIDFNGGTATYDVVCGAVCTAPATGGAGSGGGASQPAPADAVTFCRTLRGIVCDQTFKCTAAADRDQTFTMTFGTSPQECKTMMSASICIAAMAPQRCPTYDPAAAQRCDQAVAAASCADFTDPNAIDPSDCSAACSP